ncbi:AMP-binding protein [Marinobacter zhejiangensis]|uniref:Long-chain-fatty-acid--CoA ligase n=1 Tax=Marinobacter zhejiangensis TaxID=488535 RepID=A0A1I4MBP2_9GAMM|nr:AMP-binding protein [Marinobacter zhejiangensis]SFM00453.1 long-chain acyl-CoA synthetase [Marinobacter zhejiangensis]
MHQPWLENYPNGTPQSIDPDSIGSVTELFAQAVRQFPDHVALECFGIQLNYRQLDQLSDAVASALQRDFGVRKGDRVAVMLPNLFAYPIAMLAILKTGAVQVNVNPLYTPRELAHQLNDSGAEHIFIYSGSTAALADIRGQVTVRSVITVGPGDGSGQPIPAPAVADNLGQHTPLTELLSKHRDARPEPVAIGGDDILFLQYTGGTTGPSKGATLTHRNLIANTLQFKAFVPSANSPGEECLVLALPMYHIFGLMIYIAYAAIGAKAILIPNPRDMDAFIGAIKNARFSIIGGVNTLFAGMTQHPEFGNIDFSGYKVAFGGGSKIFASTSERWHATTGAHILEGFGLSETAPIVTLNPMGGDGFSGTVGYPVPSTDCKILGPDDQPLPPGEAGELCAKGPQVMKGYWGREDATREVFTSDGYFRTGDVAVMHPDGKFEIVDRKKDMLIVSGFNVYPNEIEGVVCELDSVAEAACIGIPDAKTGERVKLFVSPSGNGELDIDDVIEHCRANLAAYKVPREVVVLAEMPKSNVGKILRKDLREPA